jgi:hypothetical protein
MNPETVDIATIAKVDPWVWAWHNQIRLVAGIFTFVGHEYQAGIMQSTGKNKKIKKAAQMGITEGEVLDDFHGMIHGLYPKGVLYLFPSEKDVQEFSKSRFNPLILNNPETIGKFVQSTDAVNIKQIGQGFLYLHGARATQKVEESKESSALRSRSVDKVVFDERDLMDDDMVDMALDRFAHSTVQKQVALSTPIIPGMGVDADYTASDQRVWMLRCEACGKETCLELEFPQCLRRLNDGKVIRICKHCGNEIHPRNGQWIPQMAGRDVEGFWISQLNSIYIDPASILDWFESGKNLQRLYNSKLGMAYVEAENRLSNSDVYACCGQNLMTDQSHGPCAMGVDVGKILHVVIGLRPSEKKLRVVKVARTSSFNDVHDLAQRFNVKSAIVDAEPETRAATAFKDAEPYAVWLCDYKDKQLVEAVWKEDTGIVKANRTTLCDSTHELVKSGLLEIPRRCEEVELFVKQVAFPAKVLRDEPDGSRRYYYTKGNDHYRHALNYFKLASQGLAVARDESPKGRLLRLVQSHETNDYNPMTYGLGLGR